jgi:FkbM family methyltransferase
MFEKKNHPDREFYGFKMRTRFRYNDEKVIDQCLDTQKDVYRLPTKMDVVIDVGANIGCISLLAASRGAIVFAFEPAAINYETLAHNITLNNLSDKIHYFNIGVGKKGREKLYLHPKNSGAISAYCEQRGLSEDVYQMADFITIRECWDFCRIDHCDLLKLDCEGSERDIIGDMDDYLADRIGQISVEFHNKPLVGELVAKLSKWYIPENTHRYEWVFRKKN